MNAVQITGCSGAGILSHTLASSATSQVIKPAGMILELMTGELTGQIVDAGSRS
jgi:hypothetical protein